MAVVASDVQMVTITVNGTEVKVPKGEMVVESVKRLGVEVPIFCYHPRLKPVGMCRMCLVEVATKGPDGSLRKMPKPQTACSLPASDGLVIDTDTDAIHRDRKGVLEFLLINHPLDCPICDRGGECPLQNNTLFYGPSTSRFVEMKRHAPKAFPLSKYVTLDLERCIQCGRCVRFTEEISGDAQLAFRFRGSHMQPSTFGLTEFDSKFSGNTIEICPVGALTSSKYRFRARPWDLQTRPGICTLCSNGCNVYIDYRRNEVVRINGRTNEDVNEEWTCDRGKFGHYELNDEGRLDNVFVRKGDTLGAGEWSQAYSEILGAFRNGRAAGLASTALSNEDLFLFKALMSEGFGVADLDYRFERDLSVEPTSVPLTIQSLETAESVLVFGTSLAIEEPIVYLRVRKAWFQSGAKVVVATEEGTDVDGFAHAILRYAPGTGHLLAEGLANLAVGLGSVEAIAERTGVSKDELRMAVEVLKGAPVITTRGLYDAEGGAATAQALNRLATAAGGSFHLLARGANEEGARRLAAAPETGRDTHAILRACAEGSIDALWLAGIDPFALHPDRVLVQAALENVAFLVVQDWKRTEAFEYASVVLPMTAPTESDGSYTNVEGRVQWFPQVLAPRGTAKAAWRVASELMMRVRPGTPFFNPGEVLDQIGKQVPAFLGISEVEAREGTRTVIDHQVQG
ncbi:NADH dehydrogenase (quinone) subunit G [bacterium]|nr:MAG: NADH dehydrogenase (quinone) subunit G [bacterium]